MKLSLITVCLNSVATVRDTIESVLCQDFQDIEYIVFDGGSTDGTVEIVKSYGDKVKLICGSDKGIYDAINQTILQSSGEIVGILNSDDFYTHPNVISRVMEEFESTNTDSVYADLDYVYHNDVDRVYRKWSAGQFDTRKFEFGWTIPHPTFFVKRKLYDELGLYDTEFKLAGDYELLIRFLYKHRISCSYIPETLIKMRNEGSSNGSFKKRFLGHSEDYLAWKKNEIKPPFYTVPLKPTRKLIQYIIPKLIRRNRQYSKQPQRKVLEVAKGI